jgi:aquaporin Z
VLVALYITFEAPLSGMSMNPARSLASALPAGHFDDLWVYFAAPPLGMLAAATLHRLVGRRADGCAKLRHAEDVRCIHCGFEPAVAPDVTGVGPSRIASTGAVSTTTEHDR